MPWTNKSIWNLSKTITMKTFAVTLIQSSQDWYIFKTSEMRVIAIGHSRHRKKKFTDLQRTYRVYRRYSGERLLLKYYSIKCFTFWENIKTIINSRYRELRIYFKHMSWHGEMCGNKGGWSRYFLPIPMTDWAVIFRGLLFYSTRSVIHEVWSFGQYCLPKVSNGFEGTECNGLGELVHEKRRIHLLWNAYG